MERYWVYRPVSRVRALVLTALKLGRAIHEVGEAPAPGAVIAAIAEAILVPWIPAEVRSTLRGIRNEFLRGNIDSLYTESLKTGLGEATNTCISTAERELLRLSAGVPPLDALKLAIHINLIFDHAYGTAFDRMIGAEVPLGRATGGCWNILDTCTSPVPDDAEILFDEEQGVIQMTADRSSRPLARIVGANAEERAYLAEVVNDRALARRAVGRSDTAAEAILATPVSPGPEFRRWRDAMGQLREEFIAVMSHFPANVALFEDLVPSLTKAGQEAVATLDRDPPYGRPEVRCEFDHYPDGGTLPNGDSGGRTRT
jgi:hypothetical protein